MTASVADIQQRLAAAGVDNAAAEAQRVAAAIEADKSLDLEQILRQCEAGMPLAYALGTVMFLGIEMLAGTGALVPRTETELLGRTALETIASLGVQEPRIIDMCCGAGNLACAIASKVPSARVWATDLTDGCVSLARDNVAHLGLQDRVHVGQGDLFAGLAECGLQGTVDVVVCNPPYISTSRLTEGDRQPLLEHEPREAFDGGPYGLSIQQNVIKHARSYLRPGGYLLFEIGLGQDRQIAALFKRGRVYEEIDLVTDTEGNARVARSRIQES